MSESGGRQTAHHGQHVAATPGLAGLLMVAQRLARSPSRCFFIGGDVGVGKRTLASFIHRHSLRADRPYVVAELSTMQPDEMDLALFGCQGLLVSADGGTLVLQEITALPHRLQRKLLQVLQTRTFEAADGGSLRTVDVRIVMTSHFDLEGSDRAMLRDDLRYRITAVQLYVPALRYRRDDILALATHFLRNADAEHAGQVGFATDAVDALLTYPWPHNVHELQQVVQSAVAVMVRERRALVVASDLNLPAMSPEVWPRSSRPPPSRVLTFAGGSIPPQGLPQDEKRGPGNAQDVGGQLKAQVMSANATAPTMNDMPWNVLQYRAPTIQGVSAERLWDELQQELQRNGVNE